MVCSEDDDDDGREALIDRTAPPTVKSQRADSARADGPGILTFSADPQCPLVDL